MKITVNGTEHLIMGLPIGYDTIAELAYPGAGYRELTVTYSWRGPGDSSRHGTLYPGKAPIEPAEGMHFTAVHTGNA